MGVSVSTERHGGLVAVHVMGEVDLAAVGVVEAAIIAGIGEPDARTVVVDLSEVSFLDSSGISVLLAGLRAAEDRGIAYRVEVADGIVRKVLEMTGVWPLLSGQAG